MIAAADLNALAKSLHREAWEALYLAHARGEREDVLPFPEPSIQRLTNNQSVAETAIDAVEIMASILACADRYISLERSNRVLDYGCGWGRLTRLLPHHTDCQNVLGVDVDQRLIDSANHLLPAISHRRIDSYEKLSEDFGSFDLIFANSVFSHLSAENHRFRITDLARLLRPGGCAVLTTLDLASVQRFYDNPDQIAYVRGLLGARETLVDQLAKAGFAWGSSDRWPDYGLAVISESWLEREWGRAGLELVESRRGTHKRAQVFRIAVKP